jgi:hypothetical protein
MILPRITGLVYNVKVNLYIDDRETFRLSPLPLVAKTPTNGISCLVYITSHSAYRSINKGLEI